MLHRTVGAMIVKKYSNRRLYDTEASRYITLEELAQRVRDGADVRVVDAKTGEDLTQATLVQLILEGDAARLLPVPLLVQLVRMGDDAVAEFFGKYVSMALEWYMAGKYGMQQAAPFMPFGNLPMQATNALFRMLGGNPFGGGGAGPSAPPPSTSSEARSDEVADLRRELEQLKKQVAGKRR
jgi:polyhydroxyalkanoate synthesis repressor PhaR